MSDMFKRFTERSVKAFRLALDESESLGQDAVDTGAVLLGISREAGGAGGLALANLGITYEALRAEIERLYGLYEQKP